MGVRIFTDDRIEISEKEGSVIIKCRKATDLKLLQNLVKEYPRISIQNFTLLKDTLMKASGEDVVVGTYKPTVEIEISKDAMAAYIKLNMTIEEYQEQKHSIESKILTALEIEGITYGIIPEVLDANIEIQKRVLIAKGEPSIAGEDAKLKYFEFSAKKPELKTDGGVDHFDIHLIDPIEAGEWLGEKTPATEGVEGRTVKAEAVPAKPGRDFSLKFDRETVQNQKMSDGREILRARITGAVSVKNQTIAVDNHLIINGNVDYSTGNIDFDGFVTVKGTVEDCFSVKATYDVSVLGDMGVGAADHITSREGSVFIKGGINGKGQAKIIAKRNVYLKYCSEAQIIAEGTVQIGVYAYDAKIEAAKVEMMKSTSKIVGGMMTAKHQIVSGVIGNQFERETEVRVLGFDRIQLKTELDNVNDFYRGVIDRASKIKRQIEIFEINFEKLDQKALNTYHLMQREFEKIVIEMSNLKETIDQMEGVLKVRGDGEIKVLNQIHPKSALEIKSHKKRIHDIVTGSFYVKDNNLHHTSI